MRFGHKSKTRRKITISEYSQPIIYNDYSTNKSVMCAVSVRPRLLRF